MTKVNLALLGGFRLQTDSREPVPLSTKKAGALLAYLARHAGQAQARPKLSALLWGDHSEAQARDSLRQALSLLRKALSHVDPRALIAHEDTISFEPSVLTTDAILFEELLTQPGAECLEQAVGLYGGEFLEGFQVSAPEFESWATAERQRLREMAVDAMTKLLDHYLSTSAIERGIRMAAQLLAADPLQERVHRTLMELYCRQGRYGAALRQYRTCTDLLAKELGIDPDATTKALRREILREWNQQPGTTSGGDAGAKSLCDFEIEPPLPQSTHHSPERRQVTILVSDLVGSSELAARLDPEEVQALIGAYQRCCTPIISRSGGVVVKLSGAEMLAYFGHPQAHEHDIESAIRAGLTLVEAVTKLDCGSTGPLQLRVGIATGPVVIGDLLGDRADQPGIVGEAAQLAGSLQRVAEPNCVVIAASTRQLVGNLFDCNDLGRMTLNGFPEPIPAWRVLEPSRIDSRFEALRTATTPLIGRDEELELLLRRWRQSAHGEGRVVLLSGEPGIGKSRLAMELQVQLREELHTHLRYFCSPHHQDSALYPIISQFQQAAGFRRNDTADQLLDKLEAVLVQSSNNPEDAAPLIADLLSVSSGTRYPPLDLTPQKRKEKMLWALLALLDGLAAREPVLAVFEDVHWIDPTSLELLDLMVDRVPTQPVLLVITFRPEFAPPWIGRSHVTLLTLNSLPPSQGAEMIAGVTGGKALPRDVVDQIIDRTDGVPLFIEELTKTVVESGILVEAGDRYAVTGPGTPLSIPSTLQGSLLARLDRLPATREVAQIGAALGRSFSHELVSAVAEIPQQKLDDALVQLVRAELMFRRGTPPDAEYIFKHALVQNAAYGTLLRSRRQQLHARIAATIGTQFPETAISEPELLAHHFTHAGLTEAAIEWWGKAGDQALRRSAFQEAISHLGRAIEMADKIGEGGSAAATASASANQRLKLQTDLGKALMWSRGFGAEESKAAFIRARELVATIDSPTERLTIYHGLWIGHIVRGEFGLAREMAKTFLREAERGARTTECGVGGRLVGMTCLWQGDFIEAQANLIEALNIYDPERDRKAGFRFGPDTGAAARAHLAITKWQLGEVAPARALIEEAVAHAVETGHLPTLVNTYLYKAHFEIVRSDAAAARHDAEIVVKLSQANALTLYAAVGALQSAWASARLDGRHTGATELRRALAAFTDQGNKHFVPFFQGLLAEIDAQGNAAGALTPVDEALALAGETGEHWTDALLHCLRGEILLKRDPVNKALAEDAFLTAIAVAQQQTARSFELRAALSLAKLYHSTDRPADAHAVLASALNGFSPTPEFPEIAEAQTLLAALTSEPTTFGLGTF